MFRAGLEIYQLTLLVCEESIVGAEPCTVLRISSWVIREATETGIASY